MELAVCAIVLILASLQPVTATPHGYGVKNGAVAQAVSVASAGAFSGAAGLPIALPHGAGFSGSFSKSASSSFASSSASSSSSSFSFSGSGIPSAIGGCATGTCENGDANGQRVPNGNVNGFHLNKGAYGVAASQAGAFAGSQSYNKDGTAPSCSRGNCPNRNGADCKGPNCGGVSSSDNNCESGQCGSTISSSEPSTYNNESKEKCSSGQCNIGGLSEVQGSAANSNNNQNSVDTSKCTSGNCGSSSPKDATPSNYNPSNKPTAYESNSYPSDTNEKCSSGQCAPFSDTSTLPSAYGDNSYPNNRNDKCLSGQCGPSSGIGIPTAYGGNSYPSSPNEKCPSGQCAPSSDTTKVPSANGDNSYPNNPNKKCSSEQCGSSSGAGNLPTAYGGNSFSNTPNDKCTSGQCNPSLNAGTVPSASGDNGKLNNPNNQCTSGQCGTLPTSDNSSPNYDSSRKCTSGQCKLLSNGEQSPAGHHNIYDIPINIASSSTLKPVNYPTPNVVNAPGSSTQSSPGCPFGNCDTFLSSNPAPTYVHGTANTYSGPNYSNQKPTECNSPDCSNGAYNLHANAPGGASVPAYNKPVTYLTAPKHDPSCTSPNCQSPSTRPGYYPSGTVGPINGINPSALNTKNPICTNGSCGPTQPPNAGSYSVPLIPNKPNFEFRPPGPKCTSPNCNPNAPQTFGTTPIVPSSGVPSYNQPSNIPHGANIHTTPTHGYYNTVSYLSPNSPSNYPSPQHTSQSGRSSYKPTQPHGYTPIPNYSSNQPPTSPAAPGHNNPNEDDTIPPFVALTPPKTSNCGGSACSGNSLKNPNYDLNSVSSYPSAPIGHSLPPTSTNYPGAPNVGAKNPEKPYLGGFGAPSGLLKPNDFTLPSSTPTSNGKSTAPASHHSAPCTTGNCNTEPNGPQLGPNESGIAVGKPQGTHNSVSCSTGNCGPHKGPSSTFNLNSGNAVATAVASAKADAIAYSGGFGGPPGLLKPFDDGKVGGGATTGLNGKSPSGIPGLSSGHFPTSGAHNTAGNGALTGAGAHAIAVAGVSAGAFGGSPYGHSANGSPGVNGGCGGGCNGGGSYGSGKNLDFNTGHPKGGYQDDLYGGISGAGAAAKSISFGNSFASAHASSGAATKGGYGRR